MAFCSSSSFRLMSPHGTEAARSRAERSEAAGFADSTRRRLAALLGLAALACGSEGGNGGAGGAAGAPPVLCVDACAVTLTCDAEADTAACEAQCAKEIAGGGYLDAHVAREYFQQLADLPDDSSCLYSKGRYAWYYWTKDPQRIDALPDQPVMDECRQPYLACYGPTATIDGFRERCFMEHYRYAEHQRERTRQCLTLPCTGIDPWDCMGASQPTEAGPEPWLAGVEQPSPSGS